MKKNEALNKITDVLDNLSGVCTNRLKAESVLFELQKLGMLPPLVTKLKKYSVNHEEVVDVNEWEE